MEERGERKIKHYSSEHKILLVGEGDFSFSKCLANAFGTAVNITATSLDSEESLRTKYTGAMSNIAELKVMGCTILHEVDARTMKYHPLLNLKLFDRIVFNFPHAGFNFIYKEHDPSMIMLHRGVVRGFLSNARDMLRINGEVHVTHKTAHPFSEWKIEELGIESGLYLVGESAFYIWEYAGYTNRRGDGYRSHETFPVGACATYKFASTKYYNI